MLDGGIPVGADVGDDVRVVEGEEETELVDCFCMELDALLSLRAAESPPPTPPPIAAPNTTSTNANTIQNIRVESPQIQAEDVEGN